MGGAAMGRCGAMVLDRAGLAARLVGECDGFEILYPGIVAVTGANPVAPRTAVERLGRSLAFPHIDAAGDVALFPADELLADEAWGLEEIGRDPGEVFAALLEPDRFRQIVENNGSYHGRSSFFSLYQPGNWTDSSLRRGYAVKSTKTRIDAWSITVRGGMGSTP